jgi:hypothetical protein
MRKRLLTMVSKMEIMVVGRCRTDLLHFVLHGAIVATVYKLRLAYKTIAQAVVSAGRLLRMDRTCSRFKQEEILLNSMPQ